MISHPTLPAGKAPRAFTLVELLASIFIIALLIGILLPSVTAARNSAKNVKIKAQQKAISDALENFRSDNQKEFAATNGFPPSNYVDDPHEAGTDSMCGAMWLPRYLMGKDLQGFVPKRAVPPSLIDKPEEWYLPMPTGMSGPLERAPVYLDSDKLEVKVGDQIAAGFPTKELGSTTSPKQVMLVDSYDRPLLYYVANHLTKPGTPIVKRSADDPGIATYTFEDNSAITGDVSNSIGGWQFAGQAHKIADMGDPADGDTIDNNTETFAWYILDKKAYDASVARLNGTNLDQATVQSVQRSSFLLISAGLDGVYGTPDDVTNFER